MSQKIIVLDPTLEVAAPNLSKAPRPAHYTRVGLLDNTKNNSAALLKKVAALLGEQHPGLEIRYYRKPDLSRPAPAALLDQLVAECEVGIVGVGD